MSEPLLIPLGLLGIAVAWLYIWNLIQDRWINFLLNKKG